MASPQLENGYTKIANELLEALCRIRISGEARQVLDAVIRKTYGFNKIEDRVALSQLCLLTGLKKQVVCRSLNKLSSMKLVIKKDTTLGNVYRLNKDFDQWKPLSKKITVLNIDKGGYSKKRIKGTQKRDIQKTITKETITKEREQSSQEIGEIIDMFKVVNPSYKKLFGSPPQRKASLRLFETHGIEKIQKIIALLPKSNAMDFMPVITTPCQLEDKMGQLASGWQRVKNKEPIML